LVSDIDLCYEAYLTVTPRKDASSLTDRHEFGRVGRTYDLTSHSVDNGGSCQFNTLAQKNFAALGRFNEADVLAVGFVPSAKSESFSVSTNFALVHTANGQHQERQLVLAQIPEDITLILLVVSTAREKMLSPACHDLRVVTSGDRVEAETDSSLEEQVELNMAIALDARIRRLARRVASYEGLDDVALELRGVIEHVMVNAEHLGDSARVVDVGDRTATRVRHPAPQLQGRANHLMALLEEEPSGHRRVNASAHRHEYFHRTSLPVRGDFYASPAKR
jgi:hypothetical protein